MKRIIFTLVFTILLINFVSAQSGSDERFAAGSRKDSNISLYPLPVAGILHIDLGKVSATEPEVQLFDMLGNKINDLTIERESATCFSLQLNEKSPGFYFIKIRTSEESISRRITIAQ